MSPSSIGIRGAALLFGAACALQAAAEPPPPSPTEVMPLAARRSVMLDFAETNARAIAVGERGHVLVSESRDDWRQIAAVPVRATLTAVSAVGDYVWAVGHDGVILHSSDGGLTWALQRYEPWTPPANDDEALSRDPRFGAPLLDVLFVDEQTGYAIGAYALLLRTSDGGAHWEQVAVSTAAAAEAPTPAPAAAGDADNWTFEEDDLELEGEFDPHLNGIARTADGGLFIVAERGAAFRSRDGGTSWERVQLPYDGSMFGLLALGDQHLLAYGLRGNVLESRDGGTSWTVVETGTEISLMGGAALEGGGAVIVGANGVVLRRESADAAFEKATFSNENQETPVLAAALPLGSRSLVVAGERGIGRFQLN